VRLRRLMCTVRACVLLRGHRNELCACVCGLCLTPRLKLSDTCATRRLVLLLQGLGLCQRWEGPVGPVRGFAVCTGVLEHLRGWDPLTPGL
jgi:hypothetical protein